ncbi:ABC-three component system middle component 1 [Myroides odoratimimus]|uniref:ABC-three component system middle component 1 n=1 Tax=Myroides odoratimimus TaxID=76832 RepID=UPI0025753AA8|nr:ABC-three component system middle component 1 [Myroides odoratimimus]MDM1038372.1 hypothetical protein [Myroides odoratimimus]MDM1052655.1 hypothetical protein [Myroides odoratimimus]
MLRNLELPENLLHNAKKDYAERQLEYWIYGVDTKVPYTCHLFTLACSNNEDLNDYWEDLTENIAINFQINLEKEIERWNIYLLFLLENEVPKEIKYKIEQDKYCCRKLVEDNLKTADFSEGYISQLIREKIFSIYTTEKEAVSSVSLMDKNIETIIKEADSNILTALEGFKSNKQITLFYSKYKGNDDAKQQY